MTNFYQKIALTLCLSLSVFGAMAQQTVKLNGDIIGSKYSVDYDNGSSQSTTANPKSNVFDGNFNTFFASYDRRNGWVGLDLGTKHIIKRVGWSPRKSEVGEKRVQLAIFEGANEPDFRDAVPLYINPDVSAQGKMHYANVNVSRGFRYVRYVSPSDARCNLAELAFYGYEGEGDDSQFYQLTNIPTVSIHTYNGGEPERKGLDYESNITVIYDGGTLIQEYPVLACVRGYVSANFAKKPYNIKFNDGKSHRMMEGGKLESKAKAKEWTLLSNYGDKTLMRNLLAFEVSRRLEAPYSVWGHPVDVIMNGEYHGCYNLCDQITIDPNRVPITEMGPTDTLNPFVRGGYLVKVDAYASNEPSSQWFSSKRGTPVTINEPGEGDLQRAQYNYIKGFFNELEERLFSSNYTDSVKGYRSRLDLSSFLKHFILGEFSGNTDTYWSVYMYKDRFEDIFHVSPGWDFDLAFENDARTYPINNRSNWIYASGGSCASGMNSFVTRILNDPAAYQDLRMLWKKGRDSGAFSEDSLLAYVDSMTNEMRASADLNFKRWDIFFQNVHQNHTFPGSFQGEVDIVRNYIAERIKWFDNKLAYIEGAIDEVDSTYQIGTAQDLVDFANMVNGGNPSLNAVLTADIDLEGVQMPCINFFNGVFDGKGFAIHNYAYATTAGNQGLFGTTMGATIQNFSIDGTLDANNNATGLIGYADGMDWETKTVIRNVKCAVDLNISNKGHCGGIVGSLRNAWVDQCEYSGTLTLLHEKGDSNGGIAGYSSTGYITNCLFSGEIVITQNNNYMGGILGYVNNGDFKGLNGCLSTGTIEGGNDDKIAAILGHANTGTKPAVLHGNFYVEGTANKGMAGGSAVETLAVTADQLASGEICWKLNEYNESPVWFQQIGTDPMPTLGGTAVVYASGLLKCNGNPATKIIYTNTVSEIIQIPHHYDANGFCTICGALKAGEDGYYEIATAEALRWVAKQVNSGNRKMNLRITADLDLGDEDWTPIGNDSQKFAGNVDGGYHTISNMTVNHAEPGAGLFGTVESGTIQNLIIDASCSVYGTKYAGGLIGHTYGGFTVNIIRVGVLCDVTCAGEAAAGIVGNANSGSICNISECFTTGTITASMNAACFSGWQGNVGAKIVDSWSISKVTGFQDEAHYLARYGALTMTNCWSAYGTQGGQIEIDDVASGKLAFLLNGSTFMNPKWFQTLGSDPYPTWDSTHGVVYHAGDDIYGCITDEASNKAFVTAVLGIEKNFAQETVATQALLDAYNAQIAEAAAITDRDAFLTTYAALMESRKEIEVSAAVYETFRTACEEAITYLENNPITGKFVDLLVQFLNADIDPNETYANGSFSYIMINHKLTNEEVYAQREWVEKTLTKAIVADYVASYGVNVTIENINYHIQNDKAIVMRQDLGLSGEIIIPEVIEYFGMEYLVTEIINSAFANAHQISCVSLPKSITALGDSCFYKCENLSQIICMASPQLINNDRFGDINTRNVLLYVPENFVEEYKVAPVWQDFNIKPLLPGDAADMDGDIVVNDYERVLSFVLGKEAFTAWNYVEHYLADVNGDETINIADVAEIVNIINPQPDMVRGLFAPMWTDDSLDEISVNTNGQHEIVICLRNNRDYVAGQIDIKMPDGITIVNETLGNRASAHSLYSHTLDDGRHRIILCSLQNAAFREGVDKAILRLEVTGEVNPENVEVTNVIFADKDARLYHLVKSTGETTGIEDIETIKGRAIEDIYSLDGQKQNQMQKGVNIIRRNGKAHKVLVK